MNYLERSVKITKCLRVSDSLEPSGSCRLCSNLCFRELWLEKSESFGSQLYLNVFLLKLPKQYFTKWNQTVRAAVDIPWVFWNMRLIFL